MKNLKLLYLFVLIGLLASCDRDELLDVQPFGKVIPETVEDYRLLMNNRNDKTRMHQIDRYMTDDIRVPDGTLSDYLGFGVDSRRLDALTWSKFFGGETETDHEWMELYGQVYESLMLEENIAENGAKGSEQELQKILAELKVHRAAAYFALVNLYSVQYNSATAKVDLGVPIHANAESIEAKTPRATVQEVYDEIIKDLTEAIEMDALEESVPEINYQASEVAAYALLARTYLQMLDYEKARDAAQKALDIYPNLEDWNERLFFGFPYHVDNPEVILFKDYQSFHVPVNIYVADEVVDLFSPTDVRRLLRFQSGDNGTFITESNRQYIGPSVPEMYLIRAECNARINKGADFEKAIDDLNTLRVNRFVAGTYIDLTTADLPDAAATLTFVKEERRRELLDRGTRLFDLKRYNLEAGDNAQISITREIEGETTVLNYASPNWVVPIAKSVRNLAPEIEQFEREDL